MAKINVKSKIEDVREMLSVAEAEANSQVSPADQKHNSAIFAIMKKELSQAETKIVDLTVGFRLKQERQFDFTNFVTKWFE